jgi:hypothetical protein
MVTDEFECRKQTGNRRVLVQPIGPYGLGAVGAWFLFAQDGGREWREWGQLYSGLVHNRN